MANNVVSNKEWSTLTFVENKEDPDYIKTQGGGSKSITIQPPLKQGHVANNVVPHKKRAFI